MKTVSWRALGIAIGAAALLPISAQAQSTGSQIQEEIIVVTGQREAALGGLIRPEQLPKSRSTVTQEYIQTQVVGQSILQSVNLAPGTNFTNNDAYGSSGGDIIMRGFDSQRISLQEDGVPLNDTGNYAIYSNQQLDPELISRANINNGTTDVDSPTAAATGGTINYLTRKPAEEFGAMLQPSYGDEDYKRIFGLVDTGTLIAGLSSWVSGSYTNYDIFHGPGEIEKKQGNFRLFEDLDDGNFVSLIGHYNENRNNFIRQTNLAQFKAHTEPVNDSTCIRPVPTNGVADVDPSCSNYFGNRINPSNTGNVRGQASFDLFGMETLHLTLDPVFQYVLANGGGRQLFPETDLQLRGNSIATGVDLNGDGDTLDTVNLYTPNTTNTRRLGLTSSLIWDVNEQHRLRFAFTADYGRHRQTGDVGYFLQSGDPENVFGGKDGQGQQVLLPDGTNLRRRDRFSIAQLYQAAVEYRGQFMEDRLLIDLGLRAPYFQRKLHQFCYQRDTFNAYCTTQAPTIVVGSDDGAGVPLVTFPASALNPSAANQYGQPRNFERSYHKFLPNVGLGFALTPSNKVYASFAKGFAAPRTDDLYDQKLVSPAPETTEAYDLGYRLQTSRVIASVAGYVTSFHNRIVRTFNEDLGIAVSRNVGDVDLWGIDGEIGVEPIDNLSFYASASYIQTEVKGDLPAAPPALPVPTKGKELVEIPDWQGSLRAQYEIVGFTLGTQIKYVGERWANDINTEQAPNYTLVDADIRYDLGELGFEGSYLQLNAFNLFDKRWLGDISTSQTGSGFYQLGAPRTFQVTLRAAF